MPGYSRFFQLGVGPLLAGLPIGFDLLAELVASLHLLAHQRGLFSVQLDQDRVVLAHLAGKLRRNRIRVLAGDRVTLELSPYDLTKGRITYRHK